MIHQARVSVLSIVLTFALFAGAVSSACAEQMNQPPSGFRALFNGENLDGWRGRPHFNPYTEASWSEQQRSEQQAEWDENLRQHWHVEDGVLVNDGEGVYLTTAQDYADYELWLDWKIEHGADSGVYLHANPQVQIWDPTAESQHQHGSDKGSGGLWNNQQHERWPLVNADNPPGEWNRMFIRIVGDRVTVVLNDYLVVDNEVMENFWDRESKLMDRGPIQLQTHGGEIRFRNVFIRELVPTTHLDNIQQAVSQVERRGEPQEDRHVLVFTRTAGFVHSSIHEGARAVELMGEQTGAFTTLISDDLSHFAPGNIEKFDAILMVNTTGDWIKPREDDIARIAPGRSADEVEQLLRQSLIEYVHNGGGLAGFHAASDANYHWEDFGKLVGGYFHGHPWNAGDTVTVQVEEPDHPLSYAFTESPFDITDEIYQFREPYSRENLRVLLSLDTDRTDMDRGGIHRTDGDFAVAWVREAGEGLVFYSSLGHREDIYWNPTILQFYLDGLQFSMGDLEAEAEPRDE